MEKSDDIKVCYDKKGLFLLAFYIVILTITSLYLIKNADYISLHYVGVPRYHYHPLILKIFGWAGFLFFGVLGSFEFLKVLFEPGYFTMNNKGITFKKEGFVSWQEIEDIYYIKSKGTIIIMLLLNEKCAERIRDNYNFISRLLFLNNTLSLNTNFLNISAKNLYKTILRLKRNSIKQK